MPLDRVPTPAPLPVGSMMPLPANPLFVGREDDLVTLAKALALGGTAAIGQTAAATGLGGIGKTQLAAEFAHRYGPYFAGGVFWLGFADPDAIAGEVARAGSVAGMGLTDDFDSLPLDRQVQMVGATWQNPLPRNESVELLLKHRNDLKSDDANLDAIAEELGDLPLALHMAGNFLRLYRHAPIGDPIKYLADLRSPHLLVHPSLITEGESPTEHTQHVSRTFQLSLQRLSKANDIDALALKALAHLACFAPGEPVPRFLLLGSLEKDDDDTAQIQATDALRRLVNLGLAESEGAGDLVLHRLLAAFVAATAEDFSEAREAVEVTVEVEADRLIDEGYPAPLQAWQGHLRAVTERAADVDSNHASDLLLVLGKFMREIAAFDEAQAAFERALVIEEATWCRPPERRHRH